MKKAIFIILVAILLSLGWFFFLKAKNSKILPSQAEIGNNVDRRTLNSFRGIIDLNYERPVVQADGENASNTISSTSAPGPDKPKNNNESPADSNNLTFAILGDTQYFTAGNTKGNFQKAVANISKMNPDLVVAVGDIISNCKGKSGDAQDYANWKNILGELLSKTYAVRGNHDRVEEADKCDRFWTEAFNFPTNGPSGFSEFTYSLDMKNSHFVFLDSNKPDAHEINKTQRDWLEQDLTKNTKENVFVIFHEPAYPVSDKKGESLDASPSERNALWKILDRHNVTAVFNGHEHIVSRRKIDSRVSSVAKNNIYQFVFGNTDSFDHNLPSVGVAEYASQTQGSFGLVRVNGKEITVEVYNPNGKLLNTFTFSK